MEDWEKKIIVKNLTNLVNNTICNAVFTASLIKSKILSENDIDDLDAHGTNKANRALQLYTVIQKRKEGFNALLEALSESNQTGALQILKDEVLEHNPNMKELFFSMEFKENDELGKGTFGTVVYKGRFDDRDVAVKRILSDFIDKKIIKEISVLKTCDEHENIVRYYGSKDHKHYVLIILELCDMTLSEWVEKKSIEISPVEVIKQITVGLGWLHSKSIVHRDLKPENILLTARAGGPKAKISDFGLSSHIIADKSLASSYLVGTHGWIAPELHQKAFQQNKAFRFTYASDIFALGCLYYYVLSNGKHPFGESYKLQVNIIEDRIMARHEEVLHGCSHNILFIELMISQDPNVRPSCTTLLTYPIFWSQDRRITFLEQHLIGQNIAEHWSTFHTWQKPCKFNHTTEVQFFTSREHNNLAKNIGCAIPYAFLQDSGQQIVVESQMLVSTNGNASNSHLTVEDSALRSDKPLLSKSSTQSTLDSEDQNVEELEKILFDLSQMSVNDKIQKLYEIVFTESLSIIKGTLTSFAEITQFWDGKMKSLLHVAVCNRPYKVVKFLVKAQGFSSVLSKPRFKDDVVHICMNNIHDVESNEFEQKWRILELLFNTEPELIHARDEQQRTPLHIVTLNEFKTGNRFQFFRFVFKYHVNVNARDCKGNTPLHNVASLRPVPQNFMDFIKLLISRQADPDAIDNEKNSFLHRAAGCFPPNQFFKVANYLVSIGKTKSFTTGNSSGQTVLHLAVQASQPSSDTLEVFKTTGVDFKAVDVNGYSPMCYAIKGGRSELFLRTLNRYGVDYRVRNSHLITELHWAAMWGNLGAVKLYIGLGYDVNARHHKQRDTPLHLALESKNIQFVNEIVRELVQNGAKLTKANNMNELPIDIALRRVKKGELDQSTYVLLKDFLKVEKK